MRGRAQTRNVMAGFIPAIHVLIIEMSGYVRLSSTRQSSVRLDIRILDHAAPDFGFLLDEGGGLRRRTPGGAQVDLREMVLRFRALEHLVHGLVDLCDNCGRRLWRRGKRVPCARLEALHPRFVECLYL